MSKDTLTYRIERFDEDKKILHVTYGDGEGRAEIPIREPFPATIEEIEDLIGQFTLKVEDYEAAEKPFDRSLIVGLMGQERTARRYSHKRKEREDQEKARRAEAAAPAPAMPADPVVQQLDAIAIAEERFITGVVERVLIKRGLVSAPVQSVPAPPAPPGGKPK